MIEKKFQENLPFAKTSKLTKILTAAVLVACLFTTCGNKFYSHKEKSNKNLDAYPNSATSRNYFNSYIIK